MSEPLAIALLTGVINAAVTWGVVSTKLAWMRRDIDELMEYRKRAEAADRCRPCAIQAQSGK